MAGIGSEMMWADERRAVTTAARNAVKKGQKQEASKIKKGWRWVKIGARTKILVPCDKKGNPTAVGQIRIQKLKENLGIK